MSQLGSDTGDEWKGLRKIGAIGALVAAPLVIIDIVILVLFPQPSSVQAWFSQFQNNWLVGLLDYDLLGIIVYAIIISTLLAVYVTLRQASKSWIALSTTLSLVGMAAYFASNTAFSMLYLSNQYAAATTDAQRSIILGAGQAMLALFFYGPAYVTSFALVSTSLLITSVVMLQSPTFGRRTAYVGIITNLAGLAEYVPVPGLYIAFVGLTNGVGLGLWFFLIGRTLLKTDKALGK
jgi:hypothetical protein